MARERPIVGLDIGTTKVCAIIAEHNEENQVEITGVGIYPCPGLRKGVVVNIEATIEAIQSAIREAELMVGGSAASVYVGISGSHIQGINSSGVTTIEGNEVKKEDIQKVLDMAQTVSMPMDRTVIHVIPQDFIINGHDGIKDPLGISGVRLEGNAHIITGSTTFIDNVYKCVERAGFRVQEIVLGSLATSEATLTRDEKELGVVLIDIGGGTTDIMIFTEGSAKHTAVIGLGGNHITRDIAIGLRTPIPEAERIKKHHGFACSSLILEDEMVEVSSIGGQESKQLSCKLLSEVVEPRAEEIFLRVDKDIRGSGYKNLLASGAVITGGSSLLEGMTEISEEVLELPVRRGIPIGVNGLVDMVSSPIRATGVGLALYGLGKSGGAHDSHTVKSIWKWLGNFF